MLGTGTHAYRAASKQQLLYPKCPFWSHTAAAKTRVGQPHWMSCTWQTITNTWSRWGVGDSQGRCNKTEKKKKNTTVEGTIEKGERGKKKKITARQRKKRARESGKAVR